MFSFVNLTHSTFRATRSVSRAGGRRHEAVIEADRVVASNTRSVSAAGDAFANAKNPPDGEEPWRRQLAGAGFVLGLALKGLVLPVGL